MARRFVPVSEWRDDRHRRGVYAELEAAAYLTACGWQVEAHRFRVGRSDIDLIVRRGRLVAFVEVKERLGTGYGTAREAVGWRKRLRLGRVAAAWTDRHGKAGDCYRFDLVAVGRGAALGAGSGRRIEHVEDAWRMEWGAWAVRR
jgi:putative endonuclease